ncbi:YbgC/FadM family acyl-CoA thioesterase [Sphingomonas sp.]|uniref:YbgC/FadM family acyl-CoA thioesterase n=1 Tax=Sphingomonas sp. TaxID=28214 RepID=UPI0025DF8113|nr:YbgC/FadM family acyl-CoA thioesterase [Sphingomonas sp.]MBV9529406.1 YbgC/FadM family acyl-CoA thioesterase [Sphingomonas sp.]
MRQAEFDQPYRGGFVGPEHHYALTVHFEDTDAAGVVYHANYIKFLERARSDMLRAAGADHLASHRDGLGTYVVAEVHIRYRRPARLGDDLLILSRMAGLNAASIVIQQRVMRGAELLAEASVTAAFLGPSGRPQRQPADWIERFRDLDSCSQ